MKRPRAYGNSLFLSAYDLPYDERIPVKLYRRSKGNLEIVQRLKLLKKLPVHTGCVNTICWNETGEYLLSGSDDQQLVITNGFTYKVAAKYKTIHRANIFSAKFLPCNRESRIVSCSGDGIILYTDLMNRDEPKYNLFTCHAGTTYEIATIPQDPNSFLSCGEDATVRWYDLRVKERCSTHNCQEDILISTQQAVTAIAVNCTAPHQLAVGCADGIVRLFDRRMLTTSASGSFVGEKYVPPVCKLTVPSFTEASRAYRITSVTFSPEGSELLVSYSSDHLYLFSLKNLERKQLKAEVPQREVPIAKKSNKVSAAPVRRLRLRGDWSDTGPNARPEHEARHRGAIAQARPTLHTTLMQRMTEVLSHMLNDPATRAALSAGGEDSLEGVDVTAGSLASSGMSASAPAQVSASTPTSSLSSTTDQSPEMSAGPTQSAVPSTSAEVVDRFTDSIQSGSGLTLDHQTTASTSETAGVDSSGNANEGCVTVPSHDHSYCNADDQSDQCGGACAKKPCLSANSSVAEQSFHSVEIGSIPSVDPSIIVEPEPPEKNEHASTSFYKEYDQKSVNSITDMSESQSSSVPMEPMDTNDAREDANEVLVLQPRGNVPEVNEEPVQPYHSENISEEQPSAGAVYDVQAVENNSPNISQGAYVLPSVFPSSNLAAPHPVHSETIPAASSLPSSSSVQVPSSSSQCDFADVDARMRQMWESISQSRGPCELRVSADDPLRQRLSECEERIRSARLRSMEARARGIPLADAHLLEREMLRVQSELLDLQRELVTRERDEFYANLSSSVSEPAPESQQVSASDVPRDDSHSFNAGANQTPNQASGLASGAEQLMPQSEHHSETEEELVDRDSSSSPELPGYEANAESSSMVDDEPGTAYTRRESRDKFWEEEADPIIQKYTGHRNARTMIKEATFWGTDYVMSGSDCGHVFIWERVGGRLVKLLEGDTHVVNCLQPHPTQPLLATSGIDHDIKLWGPIADEPEFDELVAEVLVKRNAIMLEETRDTITVPASFMIRMLACLNQIRRSGGRRRRSQRDVNE